MGGGGKDGQEKEIVQKRERPPARVFKLRSHESERESEGETRGLREGVGEELRGLSVQKGFQEPALKPTA